MKHDAHPTAGWRLLPWQHLASVVVPAAFVTAHLIVGLASAPTDGAADPPRAAPDVLAAVESAGAPEGLLVVLDRQGYFVAWSETAGASGLRARGSWLRCDSSCTHADDWDRAALRRLLLDIKAEHPAADTFTLSPAEDVPYRAVTDTIAAARFDGEEPLFPYAVVSRR